MGEFESVIEFSKPARQLLLVRLPRIINVNIRRINIQVGRDFPPYEKTHSRITLGTMDEMRRATAVFRDVLRPVVPAGSGR